MGIRAFGFCILHDCNLVSESNSSAIFNVNILYLPSLFSFVHSVRGSTILVAMSGFSWAMTQWAPFSLVRHRILLVVHVDVSILKLISWARKSSRLLTTTLYDETVSIRLTDSRSSHLSTEAWPGNGEVVWDDNEDDGNRDADETNRLIGDGGRSSTETGRDRYNRGRKDSGEAVDVPILEARSSSFEGSRSSHALLNNAAARHSRVNLHDLERSNGDGHVLLNGIEDDVHIDSSGENPTAKSGGLAAKAGIIIVSSMPTTCTRTLRSIFPL